jgi:anaerobic dimethyl sulfoxide reductase subunit B (iron-sulfur subunit)
MQLGFYYDQTKCIGCGTCISACMDEHHTEILVPWRRIIYTMIGEDVAYLTFSCWHCAEPLCLSVCPANAITKSEEDGIVVVDKDQCRFEPGYCDIIVTQASRGEAPCRVACPYGAPQFSSGEQVIMGKCDFCLDRLQKGREPKCVIVCPQSALEVGPLDELIAKYGDEKAAPGFRYSKSSKPSVIFKPKRKSM